MLPSLLPLLIATTALLSVGEHPSGVGEESAGELLQRARALPAATHEARVELYERGIEVIDEDTDSAIAIGLYLFLGDELLELQRFAKSCSAYESAIEILRRDEDDFGLMTALYNLAFVRTHLGQFNRSLSAVRECADLAREQNRPNTQIQVQNLMGVVYDRMGDREGAMRAYTRALEIVEQTPGIETSYTLLNNLSVLNMNAGHFEEALLHLGRARDIAEQAGDLPAIAATISNVGDVHLLAARYVESLCSHLEALELRIEVASEGDVALSHAQIGDVYIELGELDLAVEHLLLAHDTQKRLGQQPELVATLSRLSRAYALMDRGRAALAAAEEGSELAERIQTKSWHVTILGDLAAAQEANGELELALATERRASELNRELNSLESTRAFAEQAAQSRARLVAIQKNSEIATLERDGLVADALLQRERLMRNSLVIGGVLVLGLALVGWSSYLFKRRANAALKESYRMEQRLMEARKLESLGLLSGGVAHDFNNILMVIRGNAELARLVLQGDDRIGPHLADIDAACSRATELAQQMLFYSGKTDLERVPVNLDQLARETIALLCGPGGRANGNQRIEFIVETEPHLLRAMGDRTQLGQVFLNLLTNARQAIEGDDGVVTVRLCVLADPSASTAPEEGPDLRPGDHVRIDVSDSGVGMNEEQLARLFDPFFTTKSTGRGLGLATVQAIVHRHEGTIQVESKLGEGTLFSVILPATEQLEKISVGLPLETLVSNGAKWARALVIDDELGVLKTTGSMLRALGFDTVLVSSGMAGLDALASRTEIDVVVLDLVMPEMDGRETLARIKELAPGLPVLLVSGYDRHDSAKELTDHSGVDFVCKPFGIKQLEGKLTALLDAAPNRKVRPTVVQKQKTTSATSASA